MAARIKVESRQMVTRGPWGGPGFQALSGGQTCFGGVTDLGRSWPFTAAEASVIVADRSAGLETDPKRETLFDKKIKKKGGGYRSRSVRG